MSQDRVTQTQRRRTPSTADGIRAGILDVMPVLIAVVPVAAVFGTLAVGAGMTPLQATLMSATMYAGASQMVAVDLLGTGVPVWSIILSVFAVNFRHLLYSAGMVRIVAPHNRVTRALIFFFLVDPAYALAAKKDAAGEKLTAAYYFGFSLVCFVVWIAVTWVGATFGQLITDPYALALDMILPIYFLSMLLAFRTRARWGRVVLASGVVSTLVYHAPAFGIEWLGSPWHISLGATAGILAAAFGPRRPDPAGTVPAASERPQLGFSGGSAPALQPEPARDAER